MSLSLLFSTTPVKIGGLQLDAATLEDHTLTATVTQHPVESGATVSDNVVINPVRVRIEGVISNTPLLTQLLSLPTGQNTLATKRAEDARQLLIDLQASRQPFTIATSLGDYENMIMTSISTARDAPRGRSVHMVMDFEQVTLVTSEKTDLPPGSPGKKTTVKGKKPSAGAGAAASSKNTSLLQQLRG